MQAKLIPAFLSLVACVPQANPDPNDDTEFEAVSTDPRPASRLPPNELPVTIDPALPAATPNSLFHMSLAANSPVSEIIGATAAPRDVLEQRIVTTKNEPIELAIELTPPTGDFARTIASDTPLPPVQVAVHVPCTIFGNPVINSGGKCKRTAPEPRESPLTGPITASQWKLAVVDELTRTPVSTCIATANRIACTLPPRAGIAYRIVVSANGFANLWDETIVGLGEQTLAGRAFTGTIKEKADFQCFASYVEGNTVGCQTGLEFTRYFSLDRASLTFDPIELTIDVNGLASTWQSAALTWDGGDADAPGVNF